MQAIALRGPIWSSADFGTRATATGSLDVVGRSSLSSTVRGSGATVPSSSRPRRLCPAAPGGVDRTRVSAGQLRPGQGRAGAGRSGQTGGRHRGCPVRRLHKSGDGLARRPGYPRMQPRSSQHVHARQVSRRGACRPVRPDARTHHVRQAGGRPSHRADVAASSRPLRGWSGGRMMRARGRVIWFRNLWLPRGVEMAGATSMDRAGPP